MMGSCNRITLEICAEHQILCIDAAERLAPTATNYFDGIHLPVPAASRWRRSRFDRNEGRRKASARR